MLGSDIHDPDAIESPRQWMDGLHLLPISTTMTKEKTTVLSEGELVFNHQSFFVKGYEIHMGETKVSERLTPLIQLSNRVDGCKTSEDRVIGTYFHGIFHNDSFRKSYLNHIRKEKGLPPIEERILFHQLREEAFDRLAEHVRQHVDMTIIQEEMEKFHKRSLTL